MVEALPIRCDMIKVVQGVATVHSVDKSPLKSKENDISTYSAKANGQTATDSSTVYTSATNSKVDYLFAKMDQQKRKQLKLDDISLFSVTEQRTADQITDLILGLPGVKRSTTPLIDGTACIGGNVISFSSPDSFKKVWAVELDQKRFELLCHNIEVVWGSKESKNKVVCLKGDFVSMIQVKNKGIVSSSLHHLPLEGSVVYLDPPWGGPDYKKLKSVNLHLSGVTLSEICGLLRDRARYVVLKVPTNFDTLGFRRKVQLKGHAHVAVHRNFRKIIIIVVDFFSDMVGGT
mmetsp:Transcript_4775/g.7226  ORF Transcript_4775/g.7226 Transcript_4775/m.7226 type:complete len:290 (+) Transcript_4775:87-956(+)|eukprot:CAMPEP_0171453776 /NCGR_PEP_ID=MMETSP0945-20130129/1343_1 /TAXON_ID=109269 /ORGANISM="Vaucheria litorea, Strain CCMP2940" /LENGTH=289 /DNA_ID=CAMNT_0011978699 /DNA_START=86 /DNA_END=955 /DNA_ORIENTATION=+